MSKNRNRMFSPKYKSELCEAWKQSIACKYGDNCMYAHGLNDLRSPEESTTFKTLMCKDEAKPGGCKYGDSCYYIHATDHQFKQVLAQTPAVQEANVAEHVTMSPEQDEEVDPISDQIQQLQLLQQHQQLQQLKQQQKQLPSPCDSKLNSLQAAIRSLQQQLNQIQLLAQNVQHSPAPPTLEYIEVSPAVFMLAAKAHADGETKEQLRKEPTQSHRQPAQPKRPRRQRQYPECEQKESLNDNLPGYEVDASLWHEDCPPGFEHSRTTPVQESPASIMTFNVPELAEAEETVPAPVDISDNADSLFTPAFNEGAALEQCSMEDSYHSFTAARLSQLGMSAASSGAFRFVGEFDVFTSRDDDEVQPPPVKFSRSTQKYLDNDRDTLHFQSVLKPHD